MQTSKDTSQNISKTGQETTKSKLNTLNAPLKEI
jgi:hypothetical protein